MAKAKDKVTNKTYPSVEIGGKEYTLKPIPAHMAFDLADVIEQSFGAMLRLQRRPDGAQPEELMQLLTHIMRKNRSLLTDLFAHVLGVKTEDFNDGQRFPLSTFLKLSNALGDHPDVEDFLTEIRGLMEMMPQEPPEEATESETETQSQEDSSSSERTEDTQDGQALTS